MSSSKRKTCGLFRSGGHRPLTLSGGGRPLMSLEVTAFTVHQQNARGPGFLDILSLLHTFPWSPTAACRIQQKSMDMSLSCHSLIYDLRNIIHKMRVRIVWHCPSPPRPATRPSPPPSPLGQAPQSWLSPVAGREPPLAVSVGHVPCLPHPQPSPA